MTDLTYTEGMLNTFTAMWIFTLKVQFAHIG